MEKELRGSRVWVSLVCGGRTVAESSGVFREGAPPIRAVCDGVAELRARISLSLHIATHGAQTVLKKASAMRTRTHSKERGRRKSGVLLLSDITWVKYLRRSGILISWSIDYIQTFSSKIQNPDHQRTCHKKQVAETNG